jgi:PRTRC genetic system protein A
MSTVNFPTLVGHLVAAPALPPLQGVYEYLFAANGLFLRATNARLAVQLCIQPWSPGTVRGLPPLEPYVHLHHPRLPCALLHRVLVDARARRDAEAQLVEVLYRVVQRDGKFALLVPPQQATSASVTTTLTEHTQPPLLELHSHGTLPAFWSGQDDRDEGGFCFYGVVGRVNSACPEVRLRLGVYGYWWEMPVGVLFAEHEPPRWQDLNAEASMIGARWLPPLEAHP